MKEKLSVKKNERYTLDIIDLSYEGMGVAKIDGYPLFIENALPGERVEVLVVKVGNKFGSKYEKKAELAGGIILILIGIKILLEHLGIL